MCTIGSDFDRKSHDRQPWACLRQSKFPMQWIKDLFRRGQRILIGPAGKFFTAMWEVRPPARMVRSDSLGPDTDAHRKHVGVYRFCLASVHRSVPSSAPLFAIGNSRLHFFAFGDSGFGSSQLKRQLCRHKVAGERHQNQADCDLVPFMPSLITGVRSGCGPFWTGLQTRSE